MSKILLNTQFVYFTDTMEEATNLVEDFKKQNDVIDYNIKKREKKQDVWYIVKIKIKDTTEKDILQG